MAYRRTDGMKPDPWKQRIVSLRAVLAVTTPELAKILDIPLGTVQGWIAKKYMTGPVNLRKVEHLEYLIDAGYRVRPDLTLYRRYSEKFGVGDGLPLDADFWEEEVIA